MNGFDFILQVMSITAWPVSIFLIVYILLKASERKKL